MAAMEWALACAMALTEVADQDLVPADIRTDLQVVQTVVMADLLTDCPLVTGKERLHENSEIPTAHYTPAQVRVALAGTMAVARRVYPAQVAARRAVPIEDSRVRQHWQIRVAAAAVAPDILRVRPVPGGRAVLVF